MVFRYPARLLTPGGRPEESVALHSRLLAIAQNTLQLEGCYLAHLIFASIRIFGNQLHFRLRSDHWLMTSHVNLCNSPKIPKLRNALGARGAVTARWYLQDLVSSRSLKTCISRISPRGHMRSGRSRDVTITSQWGKYGNCNFDAENDLNLAQAHGIAISCNSCNVQCFTFASLT